MKLELKHVIPYLSYRLMVVDETNEPMDVEGVDLHMNQIIAERIGWNLDEVKPVLRPLSDLFKEGNDDSEWFGSFTLKLIKMQGIIHLSYFQVDYLMSKHYDVFFLIDNNIAIDINSITNG